MEHVWHVFMPSGVIGCIRCGEPKAKEKEPCAPVQPEAHAVMGHIKSRPATKDDLCR